MSPPASVRRRLWIPALLLAALAAAWVLRPDAGGPRTGTPVAAAAERAGPGFLPEGAPLRPPPAPPPRAGAVAVDFALLAGFDYDPEADVVPEEVEALDGRLVELRGVMYYGVRDPERVESFYLMPNHLVCCFGVPRPNDTVAVELRAGLVTRYVLFYYLVRGRLSVGPIRDDAGNLLALYRIADAEVEILQ